MSKVIKKITKPISKGLDRFIPNELKPLLPYAAAFMPYLLPAGGIFSGMVGRGLASAGANAVGQLAQEGNEGELNALSLLLAGGQGALTAPGDASRGIKSASQRLRDMTSRTAIGGEIPGGSMPGQGIGGFKYQMPKDRTFFRKLADFGLEGSANLADKLGTARRTLGGALELDPTSANFEILGKAATAPIAQGTGDVAYAEGVKQKKDFDRNEAREAVEAEMRRRGLTQEYIDAVTASMSAYGYTQAEIDKILELQGYELARGGRVGLREGGLSMMGQMDLLGGAGPRPNLGAQLKPYMGGQMGGGNNLPIFPRLDELRTGVSQAETSLEDINNRLGSSNNGLLQATGGSQRVPAVDLGRNPLFNRGPMPAVMPYATGGRVGYAMGGDIIEGIMSIISKEDKDPDFSTMAETVETVEMEPKEYLFDNKLKFEVGPGENEQMSVLNALFADEEGIIPEDRKQEYYNSYINQLYRSGEIPRSDYDGYIEEGILTKPKYNMGGSVLPQGMEMDYRQGGMIPMGSEERADDVPARVSKNEFVMTADAVRAAGGGSVNKGAQRMYQLMNNLEARS